MGKLSTKPIVFHIATRWMVLCLQTKAYVLSSKAEAVLLYASLGLYLEKYVTPKADLGQDTQAALEDLINIAEDLAQIQSTLNRTQPSVIS